VTAFDDIVALEDLRRQTDALIGTARRLSEEQVRAASRCPGWSCGHVLTHVARNADAMVRMLEGAAVGEQRPMYPVSPSRDEEIEAGSGRTTAALVADLESTTERLNLAWEEFPAESVDFLVVMRSGRTTAASTLPWLRWMEVVLHHADLGTGNLPAAPRELLERLVGVSVGRLAANPDPPGLTLRAEDTGASWVLGDGALAVDGTAAALATWLTGRGGGEALFAAGPLPRLPAWG
jgi:maleylpyruvate isomerase